MRKRMNGGELGHILGGRSMVGRRGEGRDHRQGVGTITQAAVAHCFVPATTQAPPQCRWRAFHARVCVEPPVPPVQLLGLHRLRHQPGKFILPGVGGSEGGVAISLGSLYFTQDEHGCAALQAMRRRSVSYPLLLISCTSLQFPLGLTPFHACAAEAAAPPPWPAQSASGQPPWPAGTLPALRIQQQLHACRGRRHFFLCTGST